MYHDLADEPQRPFKDDYPDVVEADATGRLLKDRLGLPIHTHNVSGRRTKGGPDVATSPADDRAVGEALGAKYEVVKREEIGGSSGRAGAHLDPNTRKVVADYVKIADDLHRRDVPRAEFHETGHLIDWVAGQIPIDGIEDELLPLYSIMQTGKTWPLTTPLDRGYSGRQVQWELITEALRAYRTNPNAMKKLYPKTADRLAYAVNRHPHLNKLMHLNSILVGTGAAGIGAAFIGNEESREPRL